MAVENRRWFNPSQPQTLQIAVWLLYLNAFFLTLDLLRVGVTEATLFWVTVVLAAAGGYGIANERKWGYASAVAAAFAPFVLWWYYDLRGPGLLGLIFDIALIALLLHPMSRDYQRVWFK